MPEVSVIVAVYNCEAYIEQCISSISGQTARDLEIVVADDGSTDGTPAILERLAQLDNRIRVYSRPNSGYAGVARNLGITHARGRYIAFLDADDLYHPKRIEKALSVFQKYPDVDIVFHDHKLFRSQHQQDESSGFLEQTRFMLRAAEYLKEIEHDLYLCREDFYSFISVDFIPFHTSSMMFPKELLSANGPWFREDIYPGEDGDLWLRLTQRRRVAFANEVLSYYRQWPGGISRDRARHLVTSITIHTENLERGKAVFSEPEIRRYRAKIAQQLFELGYQLFSENNMRESRTAYKRSMNLRFGMDTLAAYLKTFAPERIVRRYRYHARQAGEA